MNTQFTLEQLKTLKLNGMSKRGCLLMNKRMPIRSSLCSVRRRLNTGIIIVQNDC